MQEQDNTQVDLRSKTFQVSLFHKKSDNQPRPAAWTFEDLRKKVRGAPVRADKDGPLFSGASYPQGKTRKNENVTELSLLSLDYDHGAAFEEDCAVWEEQGFAVVAYTTHSSYRVTDNNPDAEERFRIVLLLETPIPAAKYLALWRWAQDVSGGKLDDARKDVAGMFYEPAVVGDDAQYKFKCHEGRLLDWRELDLGEPEPAQTPAPPANTATNGLKPGADYSSRIDVFEKSKALLEEAGWTLKRSDGRGQLWARPGVKDHWGARLFDNGALRLFTSNAPPFKAGAYYNPFGIYAELKHAGDFKAAAKALAAEGYGDQARKAESKKGQAPEPPHEAEPADAIDTVFDDPELQADFGNTARFLNTYRAVTRYIYARKKFMCFDGKRWSDDQGIVEDRASKIVKDLRPLESFDIDAFKHFVKSQKPERRTAILTLARAEIRIGVEAFDADPELFNVANGTIHLPSGELRPHRPRDYCAMISNIRFDPHANCPTWLEFLMAIFKNKKELVAFIQRAIGYTLSGLTFEQVLFLLYGIGKNGKSTLVNVIKRLMGEYATHAQIETFSSQNRAGAGHNEDLARLRGARLVTAVESQESRRLDEGLIKQVTGCDSVTASYKHEHSFTFTPIFKLWFAVNHKPIIRGTDDGIWRRPLLVPFMEQFEKDPEKVKAGARQADPKLESKLIAELPGILNWALEGFRIWNDKGLNPPADVVAATKEYREESDLLGQFLAENLETRKPKTNEPEGEYAAKIHKAYCTWCEENGERAISRMRFDNSLVEKGHEKDRDKKTNTVIFRGLFFVPGARASQKGVPEAPEAPELF